MERAALFIEPNHVVIPSEVEGSRGATFKLPSRDPSTSLGMTAGAGVLPRPRKARMNWFGLGLGFAAAAAVLLLARMNVERAREKQPRLAATKPALSQTTAAPIRSLVPDGLTRVVYHRSDEGLVFAGNTDAPLRRVRSRSRETLQWKDQGTGASLRVSYPTEEIELIPVSGQ